MSYYNIGPLWDGYDVNITTPSNDTYRPLCIYWNCLADGDADSCLCSEHRDRKYRCAIESCGDLLLSTSVPIGICNYHRCVKI